MVYVYNGCKFSPQNKKFVNKHPLRNSWLTIK